MTEDVIDADAADGDGALLFEDLADSGAEAADDAVLLAGDDPAAFLRGGQYDVTVNGLDGADIDHAGVDAVFFQFFRCLDSLPGHDAVGDDGNVISFFEDLALSNLEIIVFVVENRDGCAAEADVAGAVQLGGSVDHLSGLDIVRGGHDGHAGNDAHEGNILAALVGGPVLTDGDSAVGGTDLDIEMGIADGIADDLIGPACREHGKGRGEGDEARGGHAGSCSHHVALGDATVEMAVRVSIAECGGLGGSREVSVDDDDPVVDRAEFLQRVSIALSGGDFFHLCHDSVILSRAGRLFLYLIFYPFFNLRIYQRVPGSLVCCRGTVHFMV